MKGTLRSSREPAAAGGLTANHAHQSIQLGEHPGARAVVEDDAIFDHPGHRVEPFTREHLGLCSERRAGGCGECVEPCYRLRTGQGLVELKVDAAGEVARQRVPPRRQPRVIGLGEPIVARLREVQDVGDSRDDFGVVHKHVPIGEADDGMAHVQNALS